MLMTGTLTSDNSLLSGPPIQRMTGCRVADMAALWAAQEAEVAAAPEFVPGNLATKFVEPPFTVLDTRGARWQDRRRSWLSLGIQSELGRDGKLISHAEAREGYGMDYDTSKGQNAWGGSGTSIFDPVLCELAYRWWAPEGGRILDPFAGGSVRGIVAAKLGHPYTGVDLSSAQLEANRGQAATILAPGEPVPTWLHGDSAQLDTLLPAGEMYDMIWSCPPYFDLEVYSDDPADLSNMEWPAFMLAYDMVIEAACRRLLPERFAAFVVSEVRDPTGAYRGLVPYTIHAFQRAGLRYYNEAVLVNSAGSLPLRVTKYMEASRKLGRAHQNVLCFLKGEAPRGWSYDRAAPPSPQLDLHLAEPPAEAEPPQRTLAAPAAEPDASAQVGAEPDDLAQRPSDTSGGLDLSYAGYGLTDRGPTYTLDVAQLDEEPEEQPCTRPYCILPLGHEANGLSHQLVAPEEIEAAEEYGEPSSPRGLSYDQLPDGRWVDNATGELFEEAAGGGRGKPYHPPAGAEGGSELQPAPRVGGMPAVGPSTRLEPDPPPMPLEEWLVQRHDLYRDNDPARPCWGCGRPAIGRAPDGGPVYQRHSHEEAQR
jgi:hypothetical protein